MKPRALFLDHTAELGGAELFLLALAKGYPHGRHVVLFSDGPLRSRLEQDRVSVEVVDAPKAVLDIRRDAGFYRQLLAMMGVLRFASRIAGRAKDYEVIFANTLKSMVVGAVASWIARKPLLWYVHDIISAEHFGEFNRRLAVVIGNRVATRIVANSEATKEAFVRCGGKERLVTVVYNGVDGSAFGVQSCTERTRVRSELGLDSRPVIAVFSRLSRWKGQHVLIEALRMLPGTNALLVGAPLFENDEEYRVELESQVQNAGLSERVRFLGFREDIPQLLQAVDIVVHTSIAPEPFGRVIVEGMLAEKPVVAAKGGGACEIIQDGVTGKLFTPGNAVELAQILRGLLATPKDARRIAAAGRAAAQRRFALAEMLEKLEREVLLCATA